MHSTNTVSNGNPVIIEKETNKDFCCSCNRRTWRKIVIGSTAATNLGSLAVLISGLVTHNNWLAYAGAGSGLLFSTIGLAAHIITYK